MNNKTIPVFIHEDKGYIWSSTDATCLRHKYDIVGLPMGNTSESSCQMAALGLPIQLSLENIINGLCHGWVHTVRYDIESLSLVCRSSSKSRLDMLRSKYSNATKSPLIKKSHMNSISWSVSRTKKKTQEKIKVSCSKCPVELTSSKIGSFISKVNSKYLYFSETSRRQLSIKLIPLFLSWTTYNTVWPLFLNISQRARCAIVSDLQSFGYILAEGTKFGGDFLVYPGNPAIYHACFVIQVLTAEHALTPRLLIAQARVSHATRKHFIIARTSEKNILRNGTRIKHEPTYSFNAISEKWHSKVKTIYPTIRSIRVGNHIVIINYMIISPFPSL